MKAIKPFDQVMRDINHGRLVEEVTDELTKVIEAVKATGKAGSLTVKLGLHPSGPSNEQLEIRPSIKGAAPELNRPVSLFYINSDNGLQRDDPQQSTLPGMRTIPETHEMTGTDNE